MLRLCKKKFEGTGKCENYKMVALGEKHQTVHDAYTADFCWDERGAANQPAYFATNLPRTGGGGMVVSGGEKD